MENSINRALNNTMGQSLNSLAQRGVLNSSVTNRSMNDISANAADAVAQQYQNNINTVAGLTGQQLSNTNAALGARGEIAQQQLGNTNTALGAMGDLAQQQFGNTGTVLDARGNLAQQQLGNTNEALGTRASMAQQALANSMQNNASNADIYGNLLNSAAMGITTGAAAQEAAQQPALNLWNASLGLNQGGNGAALAAASGKGTTTGTQTTSGGGNNWLGTVGGLLSAGITAWCFGADTLIKMADGSIKYIQEVVKGDKVACPHADGTETEETVLDVMEPHHADVYRITAKDDNDCYYVAFTTSTQPILCADGTFVTVGNMKLNKRLHGGLTMTSIEYDQFAKVYDLKVSGENNYYADGFVAKGGTTEW